MWYVYKYQKVRYIIIWLKKNQVSYWIVVCDGDIYVRANITEGPEGQSCFSNRWIQNHTQLLSSVYCIEIYLYSNHKKSIKLWEKSEFRCVIVIPIDISPSAIAIALFDTLTLKAVLSVYCVEIYIYIQKIIKKVWNWYQSPAIANCHCTDWHYNYKGSQLPPDPQFFWTLFKKPLTLPPPSFWTSCCKFFWWIS